MSQKQDLNAFFAKNKKKTQPAKAQPKEQDAATTKPSDVDQSDQVKQAPIKESTKASKKLDYESSEEEKADLEIAQGLEVLDKAAIDAQKRKAQQEEQDRTQGWKALEEQSKNNTFTTSNMATGNKGPLSAAPKDKNQMSAPGGGISFGRQPPKFTNNKNKKRMDEDFPELDGANNNQDAGAELSKKDQANIGMFGSQAKSSNPQPAAAQEEKKEASKPVFTSSKKKALAGGAAVDEIQNSRQNYDFSRMGMSTASSKTKGEKQQPDNNDNQTDEQQKERADRRPPRKDQQEQQVQKQVQQDDGFGEDFEVVTDKRAARRRNN